MTEAEYLKPNSILYVKRYRREERQVIGLTKKLTMKIRQGFIIFLGTLIFSLFITSCATTQGARIESERRGFMLQDKSQYSRNKGKYNRGGSYDHYRKKNKRHIKKQRRK